MLRRAWRRWCLSWNTCGTCGNDFRTGRCACPEDYSSLH